MQKLVDSEEFAELVAEFELRPWGNEGEILAKIGVFQAAKGGVETSPQYWTGADDPEETPEARAARKAEVKRRARLVFETFAAKSKGGS